MAGLLSLSVSSLDPAGCVTKFQRSTRCALASTRTSGIPRSRAPSLASEFLGSENEASSKFSAAAAAGDGFRRARLGTGVFSPTSSSRSLVARAGLGDYATVTAAAYGATLLLGGIFAFVRTGSKGSIGGGLTGAALYGATYYLLTSGSTELANSLGFGTGLLFSAVFAIRLFATGKPVPAGPLFVLSALATAVFASAYFA